MRIIYSNIKTERQCKSLKEATKLFGGDKRLATSIVMPTFRFHKLNGKLEGFFAIDVKTRRDKWRIILQPLNEEENVFDPCNIDEIAAVVKIVEIREVSAHYE